MWLVNLALRNPYTVYVAMLLTAVLGGVGYWRTPADILPPSVLKYDASAIPVGNLVISSNSRDDRELLDIADHQLRDELAGIEGLASAPVFGGVFRQVQIYVHPRALEALKLSPIDRKS